LVQAEEEVIKLCDYSGSESRRRISFDVTEKCSVLAELYAVRLNPSSVSFVLDSANFIFKAGVLVTSANGAFMTVVSMGQFTSSTSRSHEGRCNAVRYSWYTTVFGGCVGTVIGTTRRGLDGILAGSSPSLHSIRLAQNVT